MITWKSSVKGEQGSDVPIEGGRKNGYPGSAREERGKLSRTWLEASVLKRQREELCVSPKHAVDWDETECVCEVD